MPGSSVRYSRPVCRQPPPSTARHRRGKKRNKKGSKGKGRKRSKACTQVDRTAFNNNLVEMVTTEHRSMFGARGRPDGTILGNGDKEVRGGEETNNQEFI